MPVVRDGDISFFFPSQRREANAAAAYTRAFETYNADRERTRARGNLQLLLQRRTIQKAMDWITSGSLCRSCDFLPYLPDDLSHTTKFPYVLEAQRLAKLLALRFDRLLATGQREAAHDVARTLMAFGQHLRGSALVLGQEITGLAIERLAAASFQKALAHQADAVTSAKLMVVQRLLDAAQEYIIDQKTSHTAAGGGFTADQAWLRSPHAVLRCEAILNMAQATLPQSVLVKPTPSLSLNQILRKLDQAKPGSTMTLRREEFETKIEWPRKGLRVEITADDLRALRAIVQPVAQSDPDRRVRVLAQRLLDSLGEPRIAVSPPRRVDRVTTGIRRRLPPSRRPAMPPPSGPAIPPMRELPPVPKQPL